MVTAEELKQAVDLLQKLDTDPKFMTAGRRNDDAVDLCCACRVLRMDPEIHWRALVNANNRTDQDLMAGLEHIKRVKPYAEGWGPEGNEGNALKYTIAY